jgi:cardiolipin-specific phospholipase
MNGGLYFFRNLVGLSHYFQNVYAIDMLGWGLSSRPDFILKDDSVETTEQFFVESLESWRKKNKIEKMILAGHSMGGYFSVAYSEKYPERVERLILLSPVGVPLQSEQMQAIRKNATFTGRLFLSFYTSLFENGATPCSVLRRLPEKNSRQYIESYVKHRLPAITDPDEQDAISNYLYYNAVLPGSGEYCVNRILTPNVLAKKPLVNRIPLLKIPHVSFLYGSSDWMDYSGGLDTQVACEAQHQSGFAAPNVEVYGVRDAGHLLMLDNWVEFNAGVVLSAGGGHALPKHTPLPAKLSPRMQDSIPAGIEISPNEAARLSRRVQVQS